MTYTADAVFENAPGGTYYLVVQHRSSVQTWSAEGIQFSKGDTVTYDFTTGAEKSYGNNLVLVDTKYCMFCGDVNQDGYVDPLDIALVDQDSYLYVVGHVATDLNGDGYVDPLDLSLIDADSYNYVSGRALATDINGDGYVDPLDLAITDANSYNYVGIKRPVSAKLMNFYMSRRFKEIYDSTK